MTPHLDLGLFATQRRPSGREGNRTPNPEGTGLQPARHTTLPNSTKVADVRFERRFDLPKIMCFQVTLHLRFILRSNILRFY